VWALLIECCWLLAEIECWPIGEVSHLLPQGLRPQKNGIRYGTIDVVGCFSEAICPPVGLIGPCRQEAVKTENFPASGLLYEPRTGDTIRS